MKLWSKNDDFFDFQLKSFIDPKPVEVWESAIPLKFSLSLLVWLQKSTLGVYSTPSADDSLLCLQLYRFFQFYFCNQTRRLRENFWCIICICIYWACTCDYIQNGTSSTLKVEARLHPKRLYQPLYLEFRNSKDGGGWGGGVGAPPKGEGES